MWSEWPSLVCRPSASLSMVTRAVTPKPRKSVRNMVFDPYLDASYTSPRRTGMRRMVPRFIRGRSTTRRSSRRTKSDTRISTESLQQVIGTSSFSGQLLVLDSSNNTLRVLWFSRGVQIRSLVAPFSEGKSKAIRGLKSQKSRLEMHAVLSNGIRRSLEKGTSWNARDSRAWSALAYLMQLLQSSQE